MSRKAKIIMVLALALVGVALTISFLSVDKDELRVSYVGLSPTASNRVVFAISNTTHKSLYYSAGPRAFTKGPVDPKNPWTAYDIEIPGCSGTIPSGGTTTVTMPVWSPARWSSLAVYFDPTSTHAITSTRERLANWADAHDWVRVSKWLQPNGPYKLTYGPEMFGDKPLTPPPAPALRP